MKLIRRTVQAFALAVATFAATSFAGAVSYQELQDINHYTPLVTGDQVQTYVKNDTLGYIKQYHPYYATTGKVYIVQVPNQRILEAKAIFFYNVSFTGRYLLSRVHASYLNLSPQVAQAQMYKLKQKDSGIKVTTHNAVVYDFTGHQVGEWETYKKEPVSIGSPYYTTADKMYEYVFGTNFDSQMP